MKFKREDTVIITSGKHKGKQAKIKQVLPKTNQVIIDGVNQYKKHLKPQQTGGKGQIITRSRPLTTANIALVCPKCKQPTRAGYLVDKSGTKQRICRKCKAPLAYKTKK